MRSVENAIELLAAAGYTTTRFIFLSYAESLSGEGDYAPPELVMPTWEELGETSRDLAMSHVEMIIDGNPPNKMCFGFKSTVITLCQILGIALSPENQS